MAAVRAGGLHLACSAPTWPRRKLGDGLALRQHMPSAPACHAHLWNRCEHVSKGGGWCQDGTGVGVACGVETQQ